MLLPRSRAGVHIASPDRERSFGKTIQPSLRAHGSSGQSSARTTLPPARRDSKPERLPIVAVLSLAVGRYRDPTLATPPFDTATPPAPARSPGGQGRRPARRTRRRGPPFARGPDAAGSRPAVVSWVPCDVDCASSIERPEPRGSTDLRPLHHRAGRDHYRFDGDRAAAGVRARTRAPALTRAPAFATPRRRSAGSSIVGWGRRPRPVRRLLQRARDRTESSASRDGTHWTSFALLGGQRKPVPAAGTGPPSERVEARRPSDLAVHRTLGDDLARDREVPARRALGGALACTSEFFTHTSGRYSAASSQVRAHVALLDAGPTPLGSPRPLRDFIRSPLAIPLSWSSHSDQWRTTSTCPQVKSWMQRTTSDAETARVHLQRRSVC